MIVFSIPLPHNSVRAVAGFVAVTDDERWDYAYDDNGNLTNLIQKVYNGSTYDVSEEWKYKWNPRDQMTQAMKWEGSAASTDNDCWIVNPFSIPLAHESFRASGGRDSSNSCDEKGFTSQRTGTGAAKGTLPSGLRYEYDGLNLLRVDEIYGASLSESGPWRTVEVSTHRPGQLSALLHKRVYKYNTGNYTATPNATYDFTYAHDPVGNVLSVFDSSGNEEFYFAQDAFGNELPINSAFGASDWGTAAGEDYRITEHQTGKWIDEFTGLYYFHARWYDSEVGRFVGREREMAPYDPYIYARQSPLNYVDPDGNIVKPPLDPPWKWNPDYLACAFERKTFQNCRKQTASTCPHGACGDQAEWDCDNVNKCVKAKGITPTYCRTEIGEIGAGIWDFGFLGEWNLCLHAFCQIACDCPVPYINRPPGGW